MTSGIKGKKIKFTTDIDHELGVRLKYLRAHHITMESIITVGIEEVERRLSIVKNNQK